MLTYIETSKIDPHPDNPRKDLGELSELAESIRLNGILQNLTVVPWFSEITREPADNGEMDGHYRVIIGHRRLAAAKLAGLTEVPCVISNMDLREQIGTMLLENMQRNDLTLYEQAQGFQMMLNFGDSINDIAERTGFSETTIRRRVKLLDLDQEKFQKSVIRGGTLQDYAELNKIEDHELRNNVLDKIGTSNFQWELKNAINTEERNKKVAVLVEQLKEFANEVKNSEELKYVKSYYASHYDSQDIEIDIPEDAGSTKYFFIVSEYGYITLYTTPLESEVSPVNNPAQDTKQKEFQERRRELERITKQAYELRQEFIRDYSTGQAKQHIANILEFAIKVILDDYNTDYEEVAEFFGLEIKEDDEYPDLIERVNSHFINQPERYLLISIYQALEFKHARYYEYYNNQHRDDENLNTVYDFLIALGYEMSDEEQALRDGTHELFVEIKE